MRASHACATLALTAVVCSEPLHAQGLASLAARTAEERKALEANPSISRSNEDLPDDSRLQELLRDFVLTRDGFFRYATARGLVMNLRLTVPRVDRDLLAAENRGLGPLGMQKLMAENSQIMARLDAIPISPGIYTLNEVAYRRALEDAALPPAERLRLSPTRQANLAFAQSYEVKERVNSLWAEREKFLALQHRP
ncbi:MAG TPA: hypothetical protein VGQ37_02280 [Vicinamibacterales bacterium]|jgi:hypothetical protein|nr:hypothetical protein [Vicinamibacterales bacterium]